MKNRIKVISNESTYWDSIYGENPKAKLTFQKNFKNYIRSVNFLFNNNRKILYNAYPSLKIIEDYINNHNRKIRVAEIGCGSGLFSYIINYFFDDRVELTLVDNSLNALKEASVLFSGHKVNLIKVDFLKSKFESNEFDILLTGGLIEHFVGKSQRNIILEMKRISIIQIHQYPISNLLYWVIRFYISLKNRFKWPFGFEKPISSRIEKKYFSNSLILKVPLIDRIIFRLFNSYGKSSLFKILVIIAKIPLLRKISFENVSVSKNE